jgi:hypothetical protein
VFCGAHPLAFRPYSRRCGAAAEWHQTDVRLPLSSELEHRGAGSGCGGFEQVGTAWAAARPVLEEATHIFWTVTAERAAIARARALFASGALPSQGRWRAVLVALQLERGRRASVRALRRLASQRCERLVLAAHSDALADGQLPVFDSRLSRTLTGLAHTLRRDRAR